MKKILLGFLLLVAFSSLTLAETRLKQNKSVAVKYEYFLFETTNKQEFQKILNQKASEGFELDFFAPYGISAGTIVYQFYVGVMRKPVE